MKFGVTYTIPFPFERTKRHINYRTINYYRLKCAKNLSIIYVLSKGPLITLIREYLASL